MKHNYYYINFYLLKQGSILLVESIITVSFMRIELEETIVGKYGQSINITMKSFGFVTK